MKNILICFIIVILYFIIESLPFGSISMFPITIFVTFLHEFGHALATLITGGSVNSITINSDGSGCTVSAGGIESIILMGGYVGSIILGNLMILLSDIKRSKIVLYVISALMLITSIIWYDNIFSSLMLTIFAIILLIFSKYKKYILLFLGTTSVAYILKDYDIGPSSDLNHYSGIISAQIWMYIWLVIAIIITFFNFLLYVKLNKK